MTVQRRYQAPKCAFSTVLLWNGEPWRILRGTRQGRLGSALMPRRSCAARSRVHSARIPSCIGPARSKLAFARPHARAYTSRVWSVDGAALRRGVHVLCTLVVGALLAAPMLLGPATPWALRALGGEPEHHCACGMTQGKCGCPECADLEHARAQAKKPSTRPTLRSTCDDDATPMASGSPLPLVTAPTVAALASPAFVTLAPAPTPGTLHPREREAPPTPPPRLAA
jgi:hypothetical protein